MQTQILCTLGPSSLNERVIERLAALGASLFRLNLSHTKAKDAAALIRLVQRTTSVPLCLDTEGAQIRTGDLVEGSIQVRENGIVHVQRQRVPGDSRDFNLYPPDIVGALRLGDFLHLDADVLTQVVEVAPEAVAMRVLTGGRIAQNKAVTVEREIPMPPLTEKDLRILAIGRELGIRHVALSFANRATDVDVIRAAAGPEAFVISKIESRSGLAHLAEIARRSDALLIDRGDLSRQVPIEQMPRVQKSIIQTGRREGRKVYVATNLMESMTTSPVPTRAEVNDVFNTLADGADGLVLAAETAIGSYPIGCASMIVKIIRDFESGGSEGPLALGSAPISLLVEPHGQPLVQRDAGPGELAELPGLRCIAVPEAVLVDCERIGSGICSPLTGFLGREALARVLAEHRLPDGTVWPMPVLLAIGAADAARVGERLALTSRAGVVHALVAVEELYRFDLDALCEAWFGTRSPRHPGVAQVQAGGEHFVAGPVTLVERFSSPFRHYVLSPSQARAVFAKKGWNRVVAFESRNVPHRAHEWVQREALEVTHADGLFVCAALAPPCAGEFRPGAVLRSYQTLLDFGVYPAGRVVLGGSACYRRFAGPRESVQTALSYKNAGCSHVVLGPETDAPPGLHAPHAARELFDRLGDLGVTPVFFDEVGYDPASERYAKLGAAGTQPIRSPALRSALREGRELPDWFLRDLLQDTLRSEREAGRPLFWDGDPQP